MLTKKQIMAIGIWNMTAPIRAAAAPHTLEAREAICKAAAKGEKWAQLECLRNAAVSTVLGVPAI